MSYSNSKKNQRKIWPTTIILLAIVAAGSVLWWHFSHSNKMASDLSTPPAKQSQTKTIPNAQQLKNPQSSNASTTGPSSASSNSSSSSSSSPTSPTGKTNVTPFITTASPISPQNGKVNINGGVQGVVESGGTCTLTFTNGSSTVTVTKSGFINATNTTCGQMSVPYGTGSNEVSSGTWQVTLSYSSSDAYGTSSTVNMTIQ